VLFSSEFTHDDWQALKVAKAHHVAMIKQLTGVDFDEPSMFAGLSHTQRSDALNEILASLKPKDAVELMKAPQFYANRETELFGEFKALMQERPEAYDYVKKAYNPSSAGGKSSPSIDPIDALFKDFSTKLKAKTKGL